MKGQTARSMPDDNAARELIRERLLEVFESTRESPGSGFEPESFIHYLITNRDGSLNVRNSFKGKRYFVKFMRRVEITFAVCFSNDDLESLNGITKMTDRVAYLQCTPKSSLTVISNRLKEPFNFNIVIFALVLSFPLGAMLFKLFSYPGLMGLTLPFLLVMLVVYDHRRDRAHLERLRDRIAKS